LIELLLLWNIFWRFNMPGLFDTIKGVVGGGIFSSKARKAGMNFLTGTPEKHEQVSTLLPGQEPLAEQLFNAGMNPGAGGAFGASADYYRNLLSDDSADYNAFAAPQMRQFNEEIIPGLSEQFAGMGSGGLSSSSFRNAAVNAGTDLSERLGAIRANLRQQGAQGLFNIGQAGLGNFSQDRMTQPGSPGFISQVAPAIGTAAGTAIGGPIGGAIGGGIGNMFGGNAVGRNSNPYGNQIPSTRLSR
jgi:hypothetical protein